METLNEDVRALMRVWKFYLIMAGYKRGINIETNNNLYR